MPFIALDPGDAAAAPVTTLGAPRTNYGMTLASLWNELSKMVGRRDDGDPDRLELHTNFGYTDLVTSIETGETNGSLLLDVVADQPLYLLPDAVAAILGVAIIDEDQPADYGGRPLTKIDVSTYRSSRNWTGNPQQFFRHNNMLVIYPTPEFASQIVIDFRIRPEWLVEQTDSPFLGVEWHEGVLLAARWKMFAALMEPGMAIAAQNDYVNFVRRRIDTAAIEKQHSIGRSEVIRTEKQLTSRPPTRRY